MTNQTLLGSQAYLPTEVIMAKARRVVPAMHRIDRDEKAPASEWPV